MRSSARGSFARGSFARGSFARGSFARGSFARGSFARGCLTRGCGAGKVVLVHMKLNTKLHVETTWRVCRSPHNYIII